MVLIQILSLIIGLIVLVVTIVILVITRSSGKKINVLPNTPMVEVDNFRKRFTNGYSRGLLKSQCLKKNGCYLIEFYPTDVKQGDNIDRPAIQSFIVNKESRQVLSEGDISDRRTIIKTISRNPLDLPEKLRDTNEGKKEAEKGQLAFIENAFSESIPDGDFEVKKIIRGSHRGLGKDFVKNIEKKSMILDQAKNIEEKGKLKNP